MNWNQVKQRWPAVKDAIKLKWGKLDERDLESIDGDRDMFASILSQYYGYSAADAFAKLDIFADSLEMEDRSSQRLCLFSWLSRQSEKCWGRVHAARCR